MSRTTDDVVRGRQAQTARHSPRDGHDLASAGKDTGVDPSVGRDTRAYAPRQLTVRELEQYIQRKCFCSVCEYARAEIRTQLKDNSD